VETCHLCAAVREPGSAQVLAWACGRDPEGRARWLCPECARRHARDIEARLPPDWW
jgi:hypothetical protein